MSTLLTAFLLAHFEASAVWWSGFGIVISLSIIYELFKK
jgi:hypothetical protein